MLYITCEKSINSQGLNFEGATLLSQIQHVFSESNAVLRPSLVKSPHGLPSSISLHHFQPSVHINNLFPIEQIVTFPTREDRKLDLIFTDIEDYEASG